MAGSEGSQWLELSAVVDKSGHLGINNEWIWIEWPGRWAGTAVCEPLSAGIHTASRCVWRKAVIRLPSWEIISLGLLMHLFPA